MDAHQPDRPLTVTAFEMLTIASLVFGIVLGSGLTWDDVLWIPLMLWIILSVTRRKSSIARWAFTAIYAFGFALVAYLSVSGLIELPDTGWRDWVMTATALVELALLWSPGTSLWLASKRSDALPAT